MATTNNIKNEQVIALMSYPDLNNRQPDTPCEYQLTIMAGNYITDGNGKIICYGNMSTTYELLKNNEEYIRMCEKRMWEKFKGL